MEVLDVDVLVGRGLPLAPEQQPLLGRHLLDGDVLDGEAEDDGPDHAKCHLDVAVDDLLGADGDELDALAGDEVERLWIVRKSILVDLDNELNAILGDFFRFQIWSNSIKSCQNHINLTYESIPC